MISTLLKYTAAIASEITDFVSTNIEYAVDDLKNIPDAIEQGWREGLFETGEHEANAHATPEGPKDDTSRTTQL